MFTTKSWGAIACVALCLAAQHAYAQSRPGSANPGRETPNVAEPIQVELTAKKILMKDGKAEVGDAKQVKPGDLIEYRAEYRNVGGNAVRGVQATLPVPPGLAYLKDTARPAKFLASTDGGPFVPVPLKRDESGVDGKLRKVPVPEHEYRALRWEIDSLSPGQSRVVVARMRVRDGAPDGPVGGQGATSAPQSGKVTEQDGEKSE